MPNTVGITLEVPHLPENPSESTVPEAATKAGKNLSDSYDLLRRGRR